MPSNGLGRDAGEAAEGGFGFGFEAPMAGPVAIENLVESAGRAAADENGGPDSYAAGFQERQAGAAGLGEGVDDRQQHVLSRCGKREVGEGGLLLLDAGALAGEVRFENNRGIGFLFLFLFLF